MSIPSIIATVIILVICAVVAFFVVNLRLSDKYAEKQVVVGTVLYWQKGKLPKTGQACIAFTKSGKPMQVMSSIIPEWKKPKIHSKNMWTVYTYRPAKKPAYSLAKPGNRVRKENEQKPALKK